MAKTIGDMSAIAFIVFIGLLTITGIFAIWDVLSDDVLYKSLITMGILTGATMVVLIFSHFAEGSSRENPPSSFN